MKICNVQFQVEDWTLKVTLTDFGLAKVMSNTCQAGTKTILAGSPGYQPPEQLRAEKIGSDFSYLWWKTNVAWLKSISNYEKNYSGK